MATITHSIGTFNFLNMQPVPPGVKRRIFTETRVGVDGFAVWWEAERGQVYTPRTIVDMNSHALAQAGKVLYEAAVGTVVSVTYANVVYTDILIRNVETTIRDQVYGIGGLSAAPKALLIAQWDLLLIAVPEPPEPPE